MNMIVSKKLLLIAILLFSMNNLHAISLNSVVCPARHSTSQTNNIINEKFYLNDVLNHSVFKIRGFKPGSPVDTWDDLGTATLIYESANNTAFFVTAEHVFVDKDYEINFEDSSYINHDAYQNYYLYAPGMDPEVREAQIHIPKKNIHYWGKYKYNNNRYCEHQGGNQEPELAVCNNGVYENVEIKNPDIAIFKIEGFDWDSKPVDIDFKFDDVDIDGDFHLLGYPKKFNSPILTNNIPPKQNFGGHYSSSYIYKGQSGGLLVSDFGVGYAIQSKYSPNPDDSNFDNDAEKIVVTPFSEIMGFLHDKFYELSTRDALGQPITNELREKSINQFINKVLVDELSVGSSCHPTDSDCHPVDYRKINLLLRQDWQHALRISLIIAEDVLKTTTVITNGQSHFPEQNLSDDIDKMKAAVASCENHLSLQDCIGHQDHVAGFEKLKNQLLALGANTHNRIALTQMLECTLGREKAEIYGEYSRILNTLYTTLGTYISSNNSNDRQLAPFIKVSNHNLSRPQSQNSLLTSIIRQQKEDLSEAVNGLITRRQNASGQEHVFRNVPEIREISNTTIELDSSNSVENSVELTCDFFEKQFLSARDALKFEPDLQPMRRSDGAKRAAEKRWEDLIVLHQDNKPFTEKIDKCYREFSTPWYRERAATVKEMCDIASTSTDYYNKLKEYEREAIKKCYTANTESIFDSSTFRSVLSGFYKATNGSGWVKKDNWLSEKSICDWHGILCEEDTIRINLENNKLEGDISDILKELLPIDKYLSEISIFNADIRDAGSIINCKDVDSCNAIEGNFPEFIGDFKNLIKIDLRGNNLVGELPEEIAEISNLDTLLLSDNSMTGEILKKVMQLRFLKYLHLSKNDFEEDLLEGLSKLKGLKHLYLSSNSFKGKIPNDIGDLFPELNILNLDNQGLEGEIPSSLGKLNINQLFLQGNNLHGPVPKEIWKSESMQSLRLNNNKNLGGRLPVEIKNKIKLKFLFLNDTNICIPKNPELDRKFKEYNGNPDEHEGKNWITSGIPC